jgi:DNA-binding ferritin-like protein (Dps family)
MGFSAVASFYFMPSSTKQIWKDFRERRDRLAKDPKFKPYFDQFQERVDTISHVTEKIQTTIDDSITNTFSEAKAGVKSTVVTIQDYISGRK